jgi:hypothetical protein
MSEAKHRADRAAETRELIRLVRSLAGRAGMGFEAMADRVMVGVEGEGEPRRFSRAAFDAARARGLVIVDQGKVAASAEAPAFLRRALVGSDEAFQDQHRAMESRVVDVEGGRRHVRVNALESPLGAIARLKEKSGDAFLPPEALSAGERLHADFTRAQLQPRLTMAYEPRLSAKTKATAGGTADLCDAALSARFRVGKAMEALGPELCGVALDVCCFQKGLEIVERERQWPARSAKLMLRAALMALSRHYAPPTTGRRKSHAWGDEDYRPQAGDIAAGVRPVGGQPRP